MDRSKLKRSDFVLFLIAIGMLVIYISFYSQNFPHSSLKLKLAEAEISRKANQILEDLGYNTADFSYRLTLRQNVEQIRYLQKKFGLRQANEIIKQNLIPVFYWKIDLKDKSSKNNRIRFSYDSDEEAKDAVTKALSDTISLNLNLEGDLVQLEVRLGEKEHVDTLSYEQAFVLCFVKKNST